MSAGSTDRRSRWVGGVLWVALGIGFAACATPSEAPEAGSSKVAVLSDVQVEERGEVTVVTLQGVGNPLYTALAENAGRRLVVDLNQVRPEGVPDSIALVSGLVSEVEVETLSDATGRPFTRVGIDLKSRFEYDVVPEGANLAIRMVPVDEAEVVAFAAEPAPLAGEGAVADAPEAGDGFEADGFAPEPFAASVWETADADPAGEMKPEVEASEPAEPATRIAGIDVDAQDGLVIQVRADGRIDNSDSFVLENPARLVVDLPGLQNDVKRGAVDVGAAEVSRVRVGQHPEKVRLVLDGGEAADPFAEVRIDPSDGGLQIAFGAAAARLATSANPCSPTASPAVVSEASGLTGAEPFLAGTEPVEEPVLLELEPEQMAEAGDEPFVDEIFTAETRPVDELGPIAGAEGPAEGLDTPVAPGNTRVRDVAYHAGGGSARVVVVAQGSASYQLFEPDAETVILMLPEAVLLPGAEARIAPEPGGPVSLVMAFQQPETERPEVRVVVKRGPGLDPYVAREGSNVVLTFAQTGPRAPTPPAIAATQAAPAGAQPATAPGAPSTAPGKAMAAATQPAPPAAADAASPEAQGIDILQEGGLLDGKQYVGRRISLDFKDVAIDDVLRLIAEVSDLNIIAGDDVNGKVTLRLVDVPWDQALDVILMTKGLGFVKVGNVLRIAPRGKLKSENEARLQARRAREKLEDLVVKFQPVNYAGVGQIRKMVQRLLTPRGSVNTDGRTNTVIIKDIPSVIDEAVALIKAIDTPTPQVLIEAKIVEANLDFSRELGTVWGSGVQRFNDGFDTGSGTRTDAGSGDFRLHPDLLLLNGDTDLNNFVIDNPIASAPTGLLSLGAFLLDQDYNLELQLQASESTGEGKVISSPRVVTMDNQEATIEQGVSIPFQTFENGDAALEFVDAVLQLKVRPHITADKSVIMKLEVSRNAPDSGVAAPGGAPAIAKNQAKTQTLVRDGQTLVIGGIYTIDKSDQMSRVPYLHKIPIIGMLFRNKLVRDIRKELLIFVTPRIVDTPQLGS